MVGQLHKTLNKNDVNLMIAYCLIKTIHAILLMVGT